MIKTSVAQRLDTALEHLDKQQALYAEQCEGLKQLIKKWRNAPDIWVNGRAPRLPSARDCANDLQKLLEER